jgi:hypothetical protein
VGRAQQVLGVSERFACRVLGQHRSTQRKIAKTPDDDAALTADVITRAGTPSPPSHTHGLNAVCETYRWVGQHSAEKARVS